MSVSRFVFQFSINVNHSTLTHFLFGYQQHNEPELKFSVDDGIPSVQFVGCKNASSVRVNIFDVVHVEMSAKDEKLKARLVPPN